MWNCFCTVFIQRPLDLFGKKPTHGQCISLRMFLMYNQIKKSVKLRMLLLILYTLFSSGYVYRKNISAYSRFCPPVILGNTCWYLWRKLLERTIEGLSWGLCVVYWGTSADTSVFITTFCSSSILVLWEKRILALGKDCSSYISSSMFCFFRKYKMGGGALGDGT